MDWINTKKKKKIEDTDETKLSDYKEQNSFSMLYDRQEDCINEKNMEWNEINDELKLHSIKQIIPFN